MKDKIKGHVLIDGFNVIHAWPELKQLLRSNADSAKEALVERVRVIHDEDAQMVSIVFDGGGDALTVDYPGNEKTFRIIHSNQGLTADGVIEQLVVNCPDPKACTIISRDNLIRESVRSVGAVVFDTPYLMDWVARCESQQRQAMNKHRKKLNETWKDTSPWDKLS